MDTLYDFWFLNRNLWFNSTLEDDIMITEHFENLFIETVDEMRITIDKKYGIGCIILYDQISRHILRANTNLDLYGFKRENFITETNKISINYSLIIYCYFKDEINADEYAFVMLPLRHSFDIIKIRHVISETWKRIETILDETEKNKYKQFLKATYERSVIQSDDSILFRHFPKDETNSLFSESFNFKSLYDKYKHILELFNNVKLESLSSLELIEKYKKETSYDFIFKFKQKLIELPKVPFIMSISGGVDSMICSYILKILNVPFKCVHINYNNRIESEEEEKFVIEWCKILNIDLYIRKIDEINRPKCMTYNLRELYETYTRDIRYNCYLKMGERPYIILGHNQDDCFENILTNISHKTKYENLNGMDLLSLINHQKRVINIVRPMLDIPKQNIYEFASIINIPFLADSTPKWSQRGKIRDIVRPTLEDWSSECVSGLFEVSKLLKESLELVNIMVQSWLLRFTDNTITCLITELPENKIFWKKVFYSLDIIVSNISLDGLIIYFNRLKNNKIKMDINAFIKYDLNKRYQLKIKKLKELNIMIFINDKV
jgi:tRNA(Ile)-lysidine synthetase-like protein